MPTRSKRKRRSTTKAASAKAAPSVAAAKKPKTAEGQVNTSRKPTKAKSTKKKSTSKAKKIIESKPAKELPPVTITPPTLVNKKRKCRTPVRISSNESTPIARFNLAMDLWLEYNLAQVIDKGVDRESWTSYKLKTNVLFFESLHERYELVRVCHAAANAVKDTFELYRVLDARQMDDEAISHLPRPLPSSHKELVLGKLNWREFLWSESRVRVRDVLVNVTCMCFASRTAAGDERQRNDILASQRSPTSLASEPNSDNNDTQKRQKSRLVGLLKSATPVQSSLQREAASSSDGKTKPNDDGHKPAPMVGRTVRVAMSRELQVRHGEAAPLFGGSLSVGLQTS
jgi:hypothetical protein